MEDYMTFMKLCQQTDTDSSLWEKWLNSNSDKEKYKEYELLGLLPEEYEDLKNKIHTFKFYIEKRKFNRSIHNLWTGCYVKYLYDKDMTEPVSLTGWVDAISNDKRFCKIQCDDCFDGCRALNIRTMDVLEILPFKERYLIYYKTMICGNCNDCDRVSNDMPPLNCKHYEFFNAIVNKQKADKQFLELYQKVKMNENKN